MAASSQPRSSPLIAVQGCAVASGGVRLLEGVDVTAHAGELVGLTGPSGCGKSTLLRAIAGLIDPAGGEVRFQGQAPEEMGWPEYRSRVLLVAQRPVLLDKTVEENLARPFTYRRAAVIFPRERAESLLERLGLGNGRMGQPARSLSVGQQQRVCLVRALLLRPDVLLLDEPTSALDEEAADAVETLVSEEAATGRLSALIVSHDRAQVTRWCARTVDLAPCQRGTA